MARLPSWFVGRQAELETLGALVQAHDIVQVVGLSGIGKTALLAAFARLRPAPPIVADASGMNWAELEALASTWPRDAWPILDHLEPDIPPQKIGLWAQSTAPTRLLICTQRRLDLPGTTMYLGPLNPGDAQTLLERSLWEAGLATESLPLEPLSAALGGIPAMLKAAATHAAILGPENLAQTVRLQGPGALGPPGERFTDTVATLAASLSVTGLTSLMACTSFEGAFTAQDFTRVSDLDASCLSSLRDVGALQCSRLDDLPLFEMMPALRTLLTDQNLEPQASSFFPRHALWFGERLVTGDAPAREATTKAILRRLEDGNLPAPALDVVAAAHSECRQTVERALSLARRVYPQAVLGLLIQQGTLAAREPDAEGVERALEEGNRIAKTPKERAAMLGLQAQWLRHLADPPAALTKLEKAIEMIRDGGDASLEAQLQTQCACTRWETGDHRAGRRDLEAVLTEPCGLDLRTRGLGQANLAVMHHEAGDFEAAISWNRKAAASFARDGSPRLRGVILFDRGTWAHEQGMLLCARERHEQAKLLFCEAGDERMMALTHASLRSLDARLGAVPRKALGHTWSERERIGVAITIYERLTALYLGAPTLEPPSQEPTVGAADEARLPARLLAQFWSRARSGALLVVQTDGLGFRAPNTDATVDLRRRAAYRSILKLLVERQLQSQAGTSVEEIAEAGWPDDFRARNDCRNRIHVALHFFRRSGLREVLLHDDGKYALDPAVPTVLTDTLQRFETLRPLSV